MLSSQYFQQIIEKLHVGKEVPIQVQEHQIVRTRKKNFLHHITVKIYKQRKTIEIFKTEQTSNTKGQVYQYNS